MLAEETRAPERETAACYTAPSPQPPGACCGSTLLGLQRILDIFSENCTDFCTHTHVHIQVCFFFFLAGGGGLVIYSWTRTLATENFFRILQRPQKTRQI